MEERKKIRSAWEIALEKTEKLGKASPEALREMRRMEYAPAGEGLAEKYLATGSLRELEIGVNRIDQAKDVVVEAAISRLVRSLGVSGNERALAGLASLCGNRQDIQEASREIVAISEEYARTWDALSKSLREELEGWLRESLEQAGISGTAIQVAPELDPLWQRAEAELKDKFSARLDRVKGEIAKRTSSGISGDNA